MREEDVAKHLLVASGVFVGGCSMFLSALVTSCCVSEPSLLVLPLFGAVCVTVISARVLLVRTPDRTYRGPRRQLLFIMAGTSFGTALVVAGVVYADLLGAAPLMVFGILASCAATVWRFQLDRIQGNMRRAAVGATRENQDGPSPASNTPTETDAVTYGEPVLEPAQEWDSLREAMDWNPTPASADPPDDKPKETQ